MDGDFSRVFNPVSTDGESDTFRDSLLWAYVHHNSNVCIQSVFWDSSWMNKQCHVCAIDVVQFVALSKSAKFIIHSIVPSVVHLGANN